MQYLGPILFLVVNLLMFFNNFVFKFMHVFCVFWNDKVWLSCLFVVFFNMFCDLLINIFCVSCCVYVLQLLILCVPLYLFMKSNKIDIFYRAKHWHSHYGYKNCTSNFSDHNRLGSRPHSKVANSWNLVLDSLVRVIYVIGIFHLSTYHQMKVKLWLLPNPALIKLVSPIPLFMMSLVRSQKDHRRYI